MDYLIDINDFHGPLDLLLHLVKSTEMDIYEIDTHKIIEEYLNYIHKMQDLNIDIASEFLVMAATLVHLKSKMLLQVHDELVFNVLEEEKEQVSKIVTDIMENTYKLEVPLKVELNEGKDWYEAK